MAGGRAGTPAGRACRRDRALPTRARSAARYAPAHYLLGVVLRESGDPEGARATNSRCDCHGARVRRCPGALREAAQAAGDVQAAITLCNDGPARPTQGRPPSTAHSDLAQIAARDGGAAAAAFEHALALAPDDADTHYNHGVALQMQHRAEDAEHAYQRALALRPDLTAAEFNLGVLLQERARPTPRSRPTRPCSRRNPPMSRRTRMSVKCCSARDATTRGSRASAGSRPIAPMRCRSRAGARSLSLSGGLFEARRLSGRVWRAIVSRGGTTSNCSTASRNSSICSCISTSHARRCCGSREAMTWSRAGFMAHRCRGR